MISLLFFKKTLFAKEVALWGPLKRRGPGLEFKRGLPLPASRKQPCRVSWIVGRIYMAAAVAIQSIRQTCLPQTSRAKRVYLKHCSAPDRKSVQNLQKARCAFQYSSFRQAKFATEASLNSPIPVLAFLTRGPSL